MELVGKTALVTGAGRRIGSAIAAALAGAGARVALHCHGSRQGADTLADAIRARGGRAEVFQADLTSPDAAEALLPRVVHGLGEVAILIHNASLFPRGGFADTTLDDWNRLLALHLTAPFLLTRAMAAQAGAPAGKVVTLLDQRVLRPRTGHLAYNVSKGGLAAFTRIAALELAPRIQVNGIAPGPILPAPGDPETRFAAIAAATPSGRSGSPDDVVRAILFLLQNDYITGQIIAVDGGEHL